MPIPGAGWLLLGDLDQQAADYLERRSAAQGARFGWELPGGIVESGESGADAAAREIEEETGWRPTGELRHILTFQPMVGMVDSPHDLFIGYGAEQTGTPRLDAEETA